MAPCASTLIIPVENQVRELDAKLLLAGVAAERGFPVIIGSRAPIHLEIASFPRGVYLAKSMRSLSERMFGILRSLGHEIVAWDEEALVHLNRTEFYYERRLSYKTMRQVSALFAWGPENAALFRGYPGYSGVPIHLTGNARIDMARRELRSYFDEEVGRIRRRYGRLVLVNTNFGWNNHFLPGFRMSHENGSPKTEFESGLAAHRSALFEHFQEMVPVLSQAFPDLTFVIRYHPTEDPELWNTLASKHDNLEVCNEGNVIPWLIASEGVVHVGCTTAVEAAVLGTPAIAYQPVRSDDFDDHLPNALSYRAFDLDGLVACVSAALKGELKPSGSSDRKALLEQHLTALEGPLAVERMVDVLEKAGYATLPPPRAAAQRYIAGWVQTKARTALKKINMRRSGHRNSLGFHDHRFPRVSVGEIDERVQRLGRQLGRFESLRVHQLSEHIFRIDH